MQCDVYQNAQDHSPFLLEVQVNLLSDLDTRVVVPLVPVALFGRPASRLHPIFEIDCVRVVMATHLLAAVRRVSLGACVASLSEKRDDIIAAIDVLWSGV